ncbi:MAG: hypothetical protein Q7O66_03160 [Dehalococcoidia bacterium]|nr:hypothetical protein [Dehalococcoidia bacterium]
MSKMRLVTTLIVMTIVANSLGSSQNEAASLPGKVAVAGNQFVLPEGGNLFLLGANYVGGPDRSWSMWQDGLFNAGLVEQDLLKAKAAGLNTLRIFVRSPLDQELANGQWSKLDAVVALGEKYGMFFILTLYDYREDDLAKASATAGAIAQRYAGKRIILAYDLRNEPHYQDLAIAQYPNSPPPLQTDALIQLFGERMKSSDVDPWRQAGDGRNLIPTRFSSREAYIYANNYLIYMEFLKDAGDWITARNYDVSIVDYVASPDSARWKPFIDVLNQTLSAWLAPQIDAIRAKDGDRLITVGYSEAVLAGLAANNALGFISFHRFPDIGVKALRLSFDLLDDLQRSFADKAVVFEEFGYSTDSATPSLTALYETATILHMMSLKLAGGAKWSLFDVAQGWSPRENNYGLYRTDGSGKPTAQVLTALGDYAGASLLPTGKFTMEAEATGSGLRYTYSAPDALFVAAPFYSDPDGRIDFDASSVAQVFVYWPKGNVINIASTAPANIRINPSLVLGVKSVTDLAVLRANGSSLPSQRQGEVVTFSVEAGESYRLRINSTAMDSKIEIVWPQGGKPVSQAERANIGAYLFQQGLSAAVCPDLAAPVRLWRALNNGVEEQLGAGQRRVMSVRGMTFAAWDFNDIDVSAATDNHNKYYFRLSVDGYATRSSIWSHGDDSRTYLPQPDNPVGVLANAPKEVDAKIEVVWPHDNLPVNQATQVNVGVYLFQQGTLQAVPVSYAPTVRLMRSLNNGFEEQVAVGQRTTKKIGEVVFPVWEFNNVDVKAATDPLNKYYFRAIVDGVTSRSNVWSHGADARTYFPQQDIPTGVGACT